MTNLQAPFPWFGGKRRAAGLVWQALGDPGGYVEPFAGSAAVLLARPPFRGRRVETINDADGWLVNTWRAIRLAPVAVAHVRYPWRDEVSTEKAEQMRQAMPDPDRFEIVEEE